jgi:NADH dehydrogenase
MDLHVIWFVLLGVLLAGYAILDGFDLGVGMLHLFVRKDAQRRALLASIGPLWDGNEVWLVVFAGALFGAFPEAYATALSAFYLPFMLLLAALLFRAVAVEFRGKSARPGWRSFWDVMFSLSSLLISFLFGVAAANSLLGLPIGADHEFAGGLMDLLRPYALLVGVFAVATFAMHGALYLNLKIGGDLQRRIQVWLWPTFAFFAAMYVLTAVVTLAGVPDPTRNFREHPWVWGVVLLNLLAVGNIACWIHARRPLHAFLSSGAMIAAFTFLFGVALFPNLMVSNADPKLNLTIYNAASSPATQAIMLIIVAVGMPFVISYTAVIYWVFRAKVQLGDFPSHPGTAEPTSDGRTDMKGDSARKHVIIVGGGFAGLGCGRALAGNHAVRVTLIDKHNYHQFQPLLYQVATSLLAPGDVAYSLRKVFIGFDNVDVKLGEVVSVDPAARTVTTREGEVYRGDYLVLAAGSRPNFFKTPGADQHSFPLYSLDDAERLRSRILQVFEDADRDPTLLDEGALNFVIVGGGPTGVETAGALADMINDTMKAEYQDLTVAAARIYLVDHGKAVLVPFSARVHEYTATVLQEAGVILRLGTGVQEVGSGHVLLSDGTSIKTRVVVWGGGVMAAALAERAGLPQGKAGRINVGPDLTAEGNPWVYVLGDFANILDAEGKALPQLGSVALQSGQWAARNILDDITGKPRTPFQYHDKGFMAMIRRNAAVAALGAGHHELRGPAAYAAWLGIHAYLMSGIRTRLEAFMQWAWDHISTTRGPQVLDRSDVARIDWEDDPEDSGLGRPPQAAGPTTALWARPDVASLAHTAAEQFVRLAARAIRRRGRFAVALVGGRTLQPLYTLLADESHVRRVHWQRVHVFWGAECCVAADDPNSHYRTALDPFLKAVPLPAENIHRIRGEQGPEQAAAAYEQELRAFFASGNGSAAPTFDLVLVGMGDGNTAPLFAGTAGGEGERWVMPVQVDEQSPWCVTFTPLVTHAAENVTVLVSGDANADRLQQVLEGPAPGDQLLVQAIEPTHGQLRWIADEAAVSRLSSTASRILPAGHPTAPPVPTSAGHFPWLSTAVAVTFGVWLLAALGYIFWGMPHGREANNTGQQGAAHLEKTTAPLATTDLSPRAAPPAPEPHPPVKVDKPTPAQAAFNKGAEAQRKGDHATAVRHYTEALEKAPTDTKALYNRALAHLAKGAPSDAIRDLTALLAIDPGNAAAYLERGLAHAQRKDHDAALADFTAAIKLRPTDQVYLRRGLAYLAKKQHAAAIQDFTRALELNPKNADAHYNRGLAHLERKEYDPAVADFNRVLDLAPGEKVYFERGLARLRQGQYKAAIQDFTQAVRLVSTDADAYYHRGMAHLHARDNDAAIADFTEAIRLDTRKPAYNERGCAHLRRREYRPAEKDFTAAIERNARDDVPYYNRGLTRYRLRDYDGAIADLTRAIELNPKDAALSYWFRGQAQRHKGNHEAAAADRDRAVKLDPNVEK